MTDSPTENPTNRLNRLFKEWQDLLMIGSIEADLVACEMTWQVPDKGVVDAG